MTTATTNTAEAARALKARHRAMWALGDYPAVATDLVSPLGPVLVEACGIRPGDRVLDVAAGSGNAAIPAAEAGASVVASDLTPELLEAGQREAARRGTRLRVAAGRRRGPAVRRRRVRHGDVLPGRHVRAVPPGQRRRADPGVPPGRDHRPAQLDPGGLHRADVRHDEAVRPAAPARGAAAAAVGPRGACPGAARRPGHRRHGPPPDPPGRPVRPPRGLPRLLQGQLRPDDRGLPGHRGRSGADRRAGRRARRPGPAPRPRRREHRRYSRQPEHRDGVGVPAVRLKRSNSKNSNTTKRCRVNQNKFPLEYGRS